MEYDNHQHHNSSPSNYEMPAPPPPPPPELMSMPLPPPPPPAYRFGNDSYRPPSHHSIAQDSFSYRNPHAAPSWDHVADNYRPPQGRLDYGTRQGSHDEAFRDYNRDRNRDRHGDRHARRRQPSGNPDRRPFRPFRQKIPPAERALLKYTDETGPGLVLGVAGDEGRAQRFMAASDISDSEEEDMAESDQDDSAYEPPDITDKNSMSPLPEANGTSSNLNGSSEPPTKRRAVEKQTEKSTLDASVAPKWSNPDPYTVLPPVDEEQRKKRDVVKMIRKARITASEDVRAKNEAAANDDFISFSIDDEGVDSDIDSEGQTSVAPITKEDGERVLPSINKRRDTDLADLDILQPQDSDPAFGNRKRTFDDRVKGHQPRFVRKKPTGNKPTGALLDEWVPAEGADATPWIPDDKSYGNGALRLHQEICDYYDFVKPKGFEKDVRQDLLDRLQALVRRYDPDWSLYCFGSFAAGLYLPNADMDVVIISWQFRRSGRSGIAQNYHKLQKIANYFASHIAMADSIEVISSAKVPLIKFADAKTGINVDISFENSTGPLAVETFERWKAQYPAMPILVVLIKQFLKMRGMSEVVNGGLGGFSVTCMVTSLLQNLPRVQSGEVIPEDNLGEMLIEFLDFYGNQLDLARVGLNMDPPGLFSKVSSKFRSGDTILSGCFCNIGLIVCIRMTTLTPGHRMCVASRPTKQGINSPSSTRTPRVTTSLEVPGTRTSSWRSLLKHTRF